MMRIPLLVGNWKMHKTVAEAVALVQDIHVLTADAADVEIVVCPPFTALYAVRTAICASHLRLGAQNLYPAVSGAFTGEVSPAMLRDVGCVYVIVGHSERRRLFGETSALVREKVHAALQHHLLPIMCVGETAEERDAGATEKIIAAQVQTGLDGLTPQQARQVVVAYEPVWAIGTGRVASAAAAQAVCRQIRTGVAEMYGADAATAMRVLYGGSVKPENIRALLDEEDIDGALVGGASLSADQFAAIVKYR